MLIAFCRLEYLMYHYESTLAAAPQDIQCLPNNINMPISVSFEFFSSRPDLVPHRPPTIRLVLSLHPNRQEPAHIVPVTPPPRMRIYVGMLDLPKTLFDLAVQLRKIHENAGACLASGGGKYYELGKEIDGLAMGRGEKKASDLERIVSHKGRKMMGKLRKFRHGKEKPERGTSIRLVDEAYYSGFFSFGPC